MNILKSKYAFLLLLFALLMSYSKSEAQNKLLNDSIITNRWHSKRVQEDLWIKLRKQADINPVYLSANQLWWLRTKGFDFIPNYDWSNKEINMRLAKAKRNNVLPTILQYAGLGPMLLGAFITAIGYPESGLPIFFTGAFTSITGIVISFNRRMKLKKQRLIIRKLRGQ